MADTTNSSVGGEGDHSVERSYTGQFDYYLSYIGSEQAVAVAERLSRESKISAIYSSDLKRALETAETIANRCGGLKVIQDPKLRERHLGELQGFVYGDGPTVIARALEVYQSNGRDSEPPEGGESLNQLYRRCTDSLQTIGRKHRGERVVVVTHSAVIRALHQRTSLGTGHRSGRIFSGSVNVLHLLDSEEWVIKSWGDVSHLKGIGYIV